jgi:hypothetical protein
MNRKTTLRIAAASAVLAVTAMGGTALGQQTAVEDPTVLLPVPDDYTPS